MGAEYDTTTDPYGPYFILLADLAGDHRARAVVLYAYPGLQVNGQPSVGSTAADVADFDGDGHLDVVVLGRTGAVAVHPGVGDGSLRYNPRVSTLSPWGVELVDFNRDGVKDVAVWGDDEVLIILRNPVDRAFAHWNMQRFKGREQLDFLDAVKEEKHRSSEIAPRSRT